MVGTKPRHECHRHGHYGKSTDFGPCGQHYLAANHFLTCSAAPITDHRGNVIGVLDVSSDQRSFHKHTMALVRMSALMIENQLFSATFEDAITVHFHARPEFIGTLMEGIASFTPAEGSYRPTRMACSSWVCHLPRCNRTPSAPCSACPYLPCTTITVRPHPVC
ncbi:GAF domain-containing protein [Janthinobacterium lividum]|uniref:GAF domain-containing protein n=1 Tax=Janthinobacterium lividum TaxID=29581 RepID=UPI002092D5EC|nr:GAF domain-containing protein [Janthinobacterium lividum]